MIREIQIENFKSIKKMELKLGRVNVFIGENGSGKSNILEAIALAGAAAANKLDNEFLASRGIRAAEARHMRCALDRKDSGEDIFVSVAASDETRADIVLSHDGKPYSSWQKEEDHLPFLSKRTTRLLTEMEILVSKIGVKPEKTSTRKSAGKTNDIHPSELELLRSLRELHEQIKKSKNNAVTLQNFVIYSPENLSLRLFQKEGQIEPLGIQGEGLLKFLQVMNETPEYTQPLNSIRDRLKVLGWFEDLHVPDSNTSLASKIEIKDRFLRKDAGNLDQISANEGFLFLLFYFCLFSTDMTPRFFAIDNVDASLNPKLCAHLIAELSKLAHENDKQVILTTHNPATLDGLDLNDEEQRLFVISRGDEGETKIRRIKQKEGSASDVKLSTAFINGYLGGLPKNF